MVPLSLELLPALFQVVWIDLVLSGDNALVIAMACRSLPERQRRLGMILGAGAAVALRCLFAIAFTSLLSVPFIKLGGGFVLMWIAIRLIDQDAAQPPSAAASIWDAIRIIVVADAIMSLDNVIAIAGAARGYWPLLVFGLTLSIPLIVLGATLVERLFERFPVLIWVGVGILGWVAGELIASDQAFADRLSDQAAAIMGWGLAAGGAAFALACAWLRARRRAAPEAPSS